MKIVYACSPSQNLLKVLVACFSVLTADCSMSLFENHKDVIDFGFYLSKCRCCFLK